MSTRAAVLAIVGPAEAATAQDLRNAESLGTLAARLGWVVVTGGVAAGVMDAASRAAREAGGTVIGILPSADAGDASSGASIAVVTAMGQARNNIIVLSSDAVAVCGMSPGTAVEVALAVRANRPIVFVGAAATTRNFFTSLPASARLHFADTPEEAAAVLRSWMNQRG